MRRVIGASVFLVWLFASMAYSRGGCAAAAFAGRLRGCAVRGFKNRVVCLRKDLGNVVTSRLDFLRRLPLQKQLPRAYEFTARARPPGAFEPLYATHTTARIKTASIILRA